MSRCHFIWFVSDYWLVAVRNSSRRGNTGGGGGGGGGSGCSGSGTGSR